MCCTFSAEIVHIYSIKTAAESFENGAEFECLGNALTNQNCIDELKVIKSYGIPLFSVKNLFDNIII